MSYSLFPVSEPDTYPIFSEQKPSDMFAEIICNGGTPVSDCELCGRTHFNETGEYMDKGELEKLLERQQAEPDKYVAHDNQVYHGDFDSKRVVWDCPCNGLRLYEEMLWGERHMISQYICARAEANLDVAQHDAEAATATKEALES